MQDVVYGYVDDLYFRMLPEIRQAITSVYRDSTPVWHHGVVRVVGTRHGVLVIQGKKDVPMCHDSVVLFDVGAAKLTKIESAPDRMVEQSIHDAEKKYREFLMAWASSN